MEKETIHKQEKLERYDARGVQTLFKTLSRNHYNLLKMVDNKARIVLTVICSLLSMIFALFSMVPHRYFGSSYKKSGYKGTLYAENFAKLSLTEFKNEFKRIMKKGQNIYDEMIIDLYFLGKIITHKQRLLFVSVIIFLIGLITAIIYTLLNGVVAFA